MRGPGPNVRIAKFMDANDAASSSATRLDGVYGRNDRTIWMDGRPHPPDYAEYTWDGFSTGRCERGMLVVTTTHMKYGYHRRNGVPASVKSKMTEYFIRHGTELTIMQFTEDPVYLEEILARTTDFQLNPGQNVGAPGFGFEIADEIATWPKGYVPALAARHGASRVRRHARRPVRSRRSGFKEAMYPEYLPKLRKLMAEMPAMPAAHTAFRRCRQVRACRRSVAQPQCARGGVTLCGAQHQRAVRAPGTTAAPPRPGRPRPARSASCRCRATSTCSTSAT